MSQSFTTLPGGKEFLTRVDYTAGQSRGVILSVVVSMLSMFLVIGLLGALATSAWNTRKSVNPHLFTRSHICAYFVSLLLCDVTQATGSLMNIRWISQMAVVYEPYCTFQGVVKQAADVSTALWTFIIALHTFFIVFLRWNPHKYSLYVTLLCGWSAVGLIIILGPTALHKSSLGHFFGISGYWCWISNNYASERIGLDYLWLFLAAILTFAMYALVFLTLRGNIVAKGWHVKVHLHRDSSITDQVDSESMTIAKQMLLYPTAYVVLFLPIAVCRFVEWSGHTVPDGATFFSDSVFLLSGIVNVTLFVATRRVLPEHSVISRSVSRKITELMRLHKSPRVPESLPDTNSEKFDLEKGTLGGDAMEQIDLSPRVFARASSPDSDREDAENQVTIRVQSVVLDRIQVPPASAPRTPPGLVDDSPKRSSDASKRSSYYSTDSDSDGLPSPRSAPLLNTHTPYPFPAPPRSAAPFVRPPASGSWI